MQNKLMKYTRLMAAVLLCSLSFAGCSADAVQQPAETQPVPETESSAPEETAKKIPETAEIPVEAELGLENAYSAEPGQAYLAVADAEWWVQYWGKNQGDGYELAYDAGIADIQGDGYYIVSVNADTKGFRYAKTGDVNQDYAVTGLGMLAVIIPNGEKLYPGAVISVDTVKVDGEEIDVDAKNYTIAEENGDTRANLYLSWSSAPPVDARTPDGALYDEDGDPTGAYKQYSSRIVSEENFESWQKIEVAFTISGTGKEKPSAGENSAEEG